jgi:hypothetical protein
MIHSMQRFNVFLNGKESVRFMEIFIIGAWLIWKQRNDYIFNRSRPSFQSWKLGFIKEANLQASRMSEKKKSPFLSVLQLYS